jgi:hypothetical protein
LLLLKLQTYATLVIYSTAFAWVGVNADCEAAVPEGGLIVGMGACGAGQEMPLLWG